MRSDRKQGFVVRTEHVVVKNLNHLNGLKASLIRENGWSVQDGAPPPRAARGGRIHGSVFLHSSLGASHRTGGPFGRGAA